MAVATRGEQLSTADQFFSTSDDLLVAIATDLAYQIVTDLAYQITVALQFKEWSICSSPFSLYFILLCGDAKKIQQLLPHLLLDLCYIESDQQNIIHLVNQWAFDSFSCYKVQKLDYSSPSVSNEVT